jgi:hypothetical protein
MKAQHSDERVEEVEGDEQGLYDIGLDNSNMHRDGGTCLTRSMKGSIGHFRW